MRLILTCLTLSIAAPLAAQPSESASRIPADVAYLASALLEGRAMGSAGGDSAALFIARRYDELDVRGAFPSQCATPAPCGSAYFQVFEVEGVRAENVVAFIPGTHFDMRRRYIVLGAHYDHLGRVGGIALDPLRGNRVRPGADDNTSGTAAVLELGRRLAISPAPASVLLVHFDAEELGLVGSRMFVEQAPVPLDSVALMVNLDMVDRLGDNRLIVEVTSPARAFRERIDNLAATLGIPVRYSQVTAGRSDHASFSAQGVPAIDFFTGFHSDYHRTTDTPDKIDFEGILRVVDLVEALVRSTGTETPP